MLLNIYVYLIALCVHRSLSLFEDQVGKFDWRLQYVGRPLITDFDVSVSSGKRLIVATEQNVVAAIHSKNGDIAWRQIMETGEDGRVNDLLQHGSAVVVVTGGGRYIRCFSPAHGDLMWENTALRPDEKSQSASLAWILGDEDLGPAVAVRTAASVNLYALETGELHWRKDLPNSDTIDYRLVAESKDEVIVLGQTAGAHVTMVTLKTSDGSQAGLTSLPAAWVGPQSSCILMGSLSHVVCLDPSSGTLQVSPLVGGKAFKTTLLQDLGLSSANPSFVEFQRSQAGLMSSEFGLRLSDQHMAMLSLQTSPATEKSPVSTTVKLIRDLPQVVAVQVTKYGDSVALIALTSPQAQSAHVQAFELSSGAELPELSLKVTLPQHHGLPTQMYTLLFRKKDSSLGLRCVVLSQDHSIVLLQQSGRVAWVREEALSSILAVEMVDLPVSHIEAQMEDEFRSDGEDLLGMFIKRFSNQFAQLKEYVIQLKHRLRTPRHHQHLTDEDVANDNNDDDDDEDDDYLTRDSFNLHKIIVAATSAGKIYGLDSFTGRIIWRYFVRDMTPFQRHNSERLLLFVQRTTAVFALQPQCVLLGNSRVTGEGLLLAFNPITGAPAEDMPVGGLNLGYQPLQASTLNQLNELYIRPLILLDKNLKYHVYPSTSARLVQAYTGKEFMFTTDTETGILAGYSMVNLGDEDTPNLEAREMWMVNLQRDIQTITNVVPKNIHERVHSQGIVLGDRSVLYKYLNPNLVVVTAEGEDAQQKAFLNIYLIDGVSGSIVFHCSHKRAKGPVSVIHSENWIAYNYWNQKHRRVEIGVLELYEGSKQSNATAFSSLQLPPSPIVMRQGYIMPGFISTMATTITEKGITSKHVLFALGSGGILELPKMLIDARRPIEPTAEHREEGLVPYIPELPRPFEATINYNQSVYNIRTIHTSPAGLESTSLVLCYGLDIFFTKVTPSKAFDVLKEDFDYFFISSVLSAMILVSVVTQKLASKKALNRAWR